MQCFVARQPIFDAKMEIYGYELLFRTSLDNFFPKDVDADQATSTLIVDQFIVNNIERVIEGKLAFINFTENLLKSEMALHLPKNEVVIEILENVFGSPETVAACEKLRKLGYQLALDDFVLTGDKLPLVKLAHIIKIDLLATPGPARAALIQKFKGQGIQFLAEKVETQAEFDLAKRQGFTFFQGYFFCKPQIIVGQRLTESKTTKLQLIRSVNQPNVDFKQITDIIKQDVALTYKLLRYINSAAFGFSRPIESLQQAVVYLGLGPLRKWVTLVALAELGDNKPSELIRATLLRAKFCEGIGVATRDPEPDQLFLIGMFSMADALMDKALKDVLSDMPLAPEIKTILLQTPGTGAARETRLKNAFELVKAYEHGHWAQVDTLCTNLQLDKERLPELYEEAVTWAHEFLALQK